MAAALKINAAFLWEDCLELQIFCSFIFVENISFIEEWAEAGLTTTTTTKKSIENAMIW